MFAMSTGLLVKKRAFISQSASSRNSELHSSSNFFRIAFRSSVSDIPEPLSISSFRRFKSCLSLRVRSLSSGGSTSLMDLKISSRLIADDRDFLSGWRRAGPWRSGRACSRVRGAATAKGYEHVRVRGDRTRSEILRFAQNDRGGEGKDGRPRRAAPTIRGGLRCKEFDLAVEVAEIGRAHV